MDNVDMAMRTYTMDDTKETIERCTDILKEATEEEIGRKIGKYKTMHLTRKIDFTMFYDEKIEEAYESGYKYLVEVRIKEVGE